MLTFETRRILREINWKLQHIFEAVTQMELKMSQMDDEITQIKQDVAAERTAVDSATALIGGIAAQIRSAVDAALAAGATPAQLQDFTDLHASMTQQTQDLANAVANQSPSAPPAPQGTPAPSRNNP